MDAYVDELCRRMRQMAPEAEDFVVDTVYFGGGTPTLLPTSCFDRLVATLRACFDVSADCEMTCEANPATADREKLSALRALGFNRLSIGLQSVHDRELKSLGRAHDFSDFKRIFADARAAGFDNISADLMYGIPHQTAESFRASLRTLIALSPEHISAYGLKIEEGTPFYARRGDLILPDEDEEYAMYALCGELLAEAGYRKYEISNFAKTGRESRHNLRYWQGKDYLGFGVAAHSCFRGVRFGNSRDLSAFLRGEDVTEERVALTEADRLSEFVMLRLRLAEGIDGRELLQRFGVGREALFPTLPRLVEGGWLWERDGRFGFTEAGFFISNALLAELLPDV
jgi:oxygen-independent coproporphyrinogen-3 oxidase